MTVDIVEAARAEVARAAGAKSISSSHCVIPAFPGSLRRAGGGERRRWTSPRLDGVDALFLGHQHLLLPGDDFAGVAGRRRRSAGCSTASRPSWPGFWGSHLGVIDLDARARRASGWRVAQRAGRGPADRPARRRRRRDRARRIGPLGARRRAKPRTTATLTYVRSPVGRLALAASYLFGADRRRSDSRSSSMRPSAPTPRRSPPRAPTSLRCRFSRPRRRSNAAGAAGRTIIPTSRRVRSRSRTSPTSIPIPNSVRVVKVDGATLRRMARAIGVDLPPHRS